MTEKGTYEEGKRLAATSEEGEYIDEIAGSYHDGDEKEYFAQQWMLQDRDLTEEEDEGDGESENNSGGGCYIATVTLGQRHPESLLRLKSWRTQVLRRTDVGRRLEARYDVTGPAVAHFVRRHSTFGLTFYLPFVLPADLALRFLPSGTLQNCIVFACFVLGLAYGSVVYIFVR